MDGSISQLSIHNRGRNLWGHQIGNTQQRFYLYLKVDCAMGLASWTLGISLSCAWIQNPLPGALKFLSTSANACVTCDLAPGAEWSVWPTFLPFWNTGYCEP